MPRVAKDTHAAIGTVATIILLAAGCSGGNADGVSDGGGHDASVAIDSGGTMADGAGAVDRGVLESGGDSGDAGANDAGGSSDGGSADGDSGDGAVHDPGAHSAPTAAVDPARYNQAIYYKLRNANSGRLPVRAGRRHR